MKRLVRSKTDRKISGICGGLGVYFGIDSTIIRVILVVLLIFTGIFPMILLYFILTCIIPLETDIFEQ